MFLPCFNSGPFKLTPGIGMQLPTYASVSLKLTVWLSLSHLGFPPCWPLPQSLPLTYQHISWHVRFSSKGIAVRSLDPVPFFVFLNDSDASTNIITIWFFLGSLPSSLMSTLINRLFFIFWCVLTYSFFLQPNLSDSHSWPSSVLTGVSAYGF